MTSDHEYQVVDALQASQWDRELLEELSTGGVICAHVTIAIWENARDTLSNIGAWHQRFREHADLVGPGRTVEEIEQVARSGRTAIVLGFQNGSPFEDDFALVEIFHRLGVRIAQLTYNIQNHIASSCYEPNDSGLSRFGKSVVREMNRCGMVVDLSHVGNRSTLHAIDVSQRPVAITHANLASVYPAPRNKPDEVLRALTDNGGVLGCTPHPGLTNGKVALREWCEMVAEAVELMGIDHVGIGSDTADHWTHGGMTWIVRGRWWSQDESDYAPPEDPWDPDPVMRDERMNFPWPDFFGSPVDFPKLPPGLRDVGFSDEEIAKIMGGNWLRLFEDGFRPEGDVGSVSLAPTSTV